MFSQQPAWRIIGEVGRLVSTKQRFAKPLRHMDVITATSTHVLVATKVARLDRVRLLANRGRMPGFAN